MTAALLHFTLSDFSGGDAPGLARSTRCHVLPACERLPSRRSLGQPGWLMGPGLQVLGPLQPQNQGAHQDVLLPARGVQHHRCRMLWTTQQPGWFMPGEDLALPSRLPRDKTSLETPAKTSAWRQLGEEKPQKHDKLKNGESWQP